MAVNLGALFQFQEVDHGTKDITAFLTLDDQFPFFNGHFPGFPVLPAVSIIDASFELLKVKFPELSTTNINLKRCKFTNTIRPGELVFIHAEQVKEKSWKVTWFDETKKRPMAQVNVLVP